MHRIAIGKEILTLAQRGILGAHGEFMVPWINKEVRKELELRDAEIVWVAKAGAIDKEGMSRATFIGEKIKKQSVNHAYTLFQLGQLVISTELKLNKEFCILHAMDSIRLPQPISLWIQENTEEALLFFTKIEMKSVDGEKAQEIARELLDTNFNLRTSEDSESKMSGTSKLGTLCPYCCVTIKDDRLEQHKRSRCPKAPQEVLASRPSKPARLQRRVGPTNLGKGSGSGFVRCSLCGKPAMFGANCCYTCNTK